MTPVPSAGRVLWISLLAIGLGIAMTGVAQFLLWLIDFFTTLSFFSRLSFCFLSFDPDP